MSVEPAIAAAIQSGSVPADITAEFLMESRNQQAKIAVLFVGVLTLIIVVLRFISRWSVGRLGIDDAFAGLTVVGTSPSVPSPSFPLPQD
jgi:hypothetical protein